MGLRALAAAAAILSIAATGAAHAQPLHFVYSDSNGVDFSFNMDSNPTPDSYMEGQDPVEPLGPGGPTLYLFAGSATFNNPSSVGGVTFYTDGLIDGGGLTTGDGQVNMSGDVVFDGDPSTPQFSVGTFNFIDSSDGLPSCVFLECLASISPQDTTPLPTGTLVVTDLGAVSGAPEPSTWALMLGGVGILGGMLRLATARRREDMASA